MMLFDAGRRKELRGGTISQSDRSRLVQQQHIHVARGFDCTPRHGDDVSLNQAVHAGNADSGQKTSNGRGNQANEKRDQYEDVLRGARIDGKRLKSHDCQQEDDGQPSQQDVEGNFVGSFLT